MKIHKSKVICTVLILSISFTNNYWEGIKRESMDSTISYIKAIAVEENEEHIYTIISSSLTVHTHNLKVI